MKHIAAEGYVEEAVAIKRNGARAFPSGRNRDDIVVAQNTSDLHFGGACARSRSRIVRS